MIGKRKIRTRPDRPDDTAEISGWLDGKRTYIWLGVHGLPVGTISGRSLYRLAKAIVRHFEEDRDA